MFVEHFCSFYSGLFIPTFKYFFNNFRVAMLIYEVIMIFKCSDLFF